MGHGVAAGLEQLPDAAAALVGLRGAGVAEGEDGAACGEVARSCAMLRVGVGHGGVFGLLFLRDGGALVDEAFIWVHMNDDRVAALLEGDVDAAGAAAVDGEDF